MVGFIPENYIVLPDENEEMVDAPDFTDPPTGTVLPAKSDNDIMFCLQSY